MSKRRISKLFETNGRGQSSRAAALPGQLRSRSACLLPWTIQQPPSTATLVRGAGEIDWWTSTRSVRPSSHAREIPVDGARPALCRCDRWTVAGLYRQDSYSRRRQPHLRPDRYRTKGAVNQALPPGAGGSRKAAGGRPSGRGRVVSGARGLVRGVAVSFRGRPAGGRFRKERCIEILKECGHLRTGPWFSMVSLYRVPRGLSPQDTERFLRENGKEVCCPRG
jgi:hypothetical protein